MTNTGAYQGVGVAGGQGLALPPYAHERGRLGMGVWIGTDNAKHSCAHTDADRLTDAAKLARLRGVGGVPPGTPAWSNVYRGMGSSRGYFYSHNTCEATFRFPIFRTEVKGYTR